MAPTLSTYLLVLPLVFLAAVVDAIAGGGGLISLPAYTVAGLDYDFASGNVIFALALPAVCCSIAGGWLGAKLALTRGAKLIRVVMLFVLALLTVRLAVEWLA